MDLTTVNGFAAALIGENDDELKSFIDSKIGLELREFCDGVAAFAAHATIQNPLPIEKAMDRLDKDSKRYVDFVNTAAGAFMEQYPYLSIQAKDLLRRRMRLVALHHFDAMLRDAYLKARANHSTGGAIVQ